MTPITLPDILEAMADAIPDHTAVFTMDRAYSYAELDERASRLANHLIGQGIEPGDHVAVHSRNRIEWVDAFYGIMKARAVPININHKYLHDELDHLYRSSDAVAAIIGPEHVEAVANLDLGIPTLVLGEAYDAAVSAASKERPDVERSADDRYVIYTGGTTGMPKGVEWRQEDIIRAAMNASRFGAPFETVEQLTEEAAARETPMMLLACGPMMHGGSQWIMGNGHVAGCAVALYTEPTWSAETILDLVEAAGVNSLTFLGDAMGRPVAEAILREPERWDLSSLFAVSNGAAPISAGVRSQLQQALPGRYLLDTYGASESGATGMHVDEGKEGAQAAPRFQVGMDVQVFDTDLSPCAPGESGMLARTGPIPLGYYGDPVKTAATFKEIDGQRWSIPGDFARREEDGSITVLGRGSGCINTGGEKVFPEEVEAVLLRHEDVFDTAVVGTPNERWGQQVTALVQLRDGAQASPEALRTHCRSLISAYKVPKDILLVERVPRTPVSKVDYRASAAVAAELLEAHT
ncbi:acyl-CoA synthetase (AMP-forming)/AMP-acid ligase II [Nocardioides albertanoniae]|uniref:Acyl-CoA synthetase (AMP-forming)/AMP-acid ligase II n=1 Tax=Nocardioides albertanoniae TaxID=1175486 RepID=A0A543A388_9ACTN|nr:AMP-binding protein [Nocardioides albertanoniae]TQL67047.1 acyl-CoA synthetase (AMP-forming)/AMP-acid ligase II [Nocardioides albertanoniae]